MSRRRFIGLLGGAVAASVVGAGGVVGLDGRLRHKLEDAWAYADGPDLSLPFSGARILTGTFESRFMHREVGWAYSPPAKVKPRAIVLSLYGKGANQFAAFDNLHLPDAAASVERHRTAMLAGPSHAVLALDHGIAVHRASLAWARGTWEMLATAPPGRSALLEGPTA